MSEPSAELIAKISKCREAEELSRERNATAAASSSDLEQPELQRALLMMIEKYAGAKPDLRGFPTLSSTEFAPVLTWALKVKEQANKAPAAIPRVELLMSDRVATSLKRRLEEHFKLKRFPVDIDLALEVIFFLTRPSSHLEAVLALRSFRMATGVDPVDAIEDYEFQFRFVASALGNWKSEDMVAAFIKGLPPYVDIAELFYDAQPNIRVQELATMLVQHARTTKSADLVKTLRARASGGANLASPEKANAFCQYCRSRDHFAGYCPVKSRDIRYRQAAQATTTTRGAPSQQPLKPQNALQSVQSAQRPEKLRKKRSLLVIPLLPVRAQGRTISELEPVSHLPSRK